MSSDIALTIAISDYDHVRDLRDGRVETPGLDLRFFDMPIPQLFGRFTTYREWDVSEFGMGKYVALKSRGDESLTAIPVFPSRTYRHTAIYVRSDSPLERLDELAGKRVGVPEWAQTAVVYVRGMLTQTAGVDLASIEWVQGGVNEPGRREKVAVHLPEGVGVEGGLDSSLDELLRTGQVDAVISAQPPAAFVAGDPSVRRLFANPLALEEAYFAATGIFPIMHVVAIRKDVMDAHPWVAGNLLSAFEEAKRRSLARVSDAMIPRFPLPWANLRADAARELFGHDFWPYGIDPNRTTLESFLRFAFEQGVAARLIAPEDLFTPQTHKPFRI
jgi:4,5-dihydroxyphthalate decarboxylase